MRQDNRRINNCPEHRINCPKRDIHINYVVKGPLSRNKDGLFIIDRLLYTPHKSARSISWEWPVSKCFVVFPIPYLYKISESICFPVFHK